MNVYEEVLQWSVDRPTWQRDALRWLIETDELAEAELVELVDLCKTRTGWRMPVVPYRSLRSSSGARQARRGREADLNLPSPRR